jgi:transposase
MLEKIALALGGRPGARMTRQLAVTVSRTTLLRLIRALPVPEPGIVAVAQQARELDEHVTYLADRWQQGCTNAARLTTELRGRGYQSSERSVRRLLHTRRSDTITPAAMTTSAPKARQITGWITGPVADRTKRERADLNSILRRCQSLRTVDHLVSDFAGTLRHRQGQHLNTWIAQAQASGVTQLAGFAAGLLKDYDAVRNGLTLGWNSGAVEGNVEQAGGGDVFG